MADLPWDSHSALVPQGSWLQGSNWQLTNGSPMYPTQKQLIRRHHLKILIWILFLPGLHLHTALLPRDSQSAFAPQGSLKQGFNSQLKRANNFCWIKYLPLLRNQYLISLLVFPSNLLIGSNPNNEEKSLCWSKLVDKRTKRTSCLAPNRHVKTSADSACNNEKWNMS